MSDQPPPPHTHTHTHECAASTSAELGVWACHRNWLAPFQWGASVGLPLLAFGPQLPCLWARGHAGLPLPAIGPQKACPFPGFAGLVVVGLRAVVGSASPLSGRPASAGLRAAEGLRPRLAGLAVVGHRTAVGSASRLSGRLALVGLRPDPIVPFSHVGSSHACGGRE